MSTTRLVEPPPPPDPVLTRYGMYAEDGKIVFERSQHHWGRRRRPRLRYIYFTQERQLWRVYVRNNRKLRNTATYSTPATYIESYRLEPVWPKHMQMDTGL